MPTAETEDLREIDAAVAEKVLRALRSYRMHHDGGGMHLVDALTPSADETIKRGEEELRLIAEHIADKLSAAPHSKS